MESFIWVVTGLACYAFGRYWRGRHERQKLADNLLQVVPIFPTPTMLRGGCPDGHEPGVPLNDRYAECPLISRRRGVWADMLAAARHP